MKSLNGYLHVEVRPEFLPPIMMFVGTGEASISPEGVAHLPPPLLVPRFANQVVHADVIGDSLPSNAFVAGKSEVVFDLANAMALPKLGKLKDGEHEYTYFIHLDALLAADGIDKPPEDKA